MKDILVHREDQNVSDYAIIYNTLHKDPCNAEEEAVQVNGLEVAFGDGYKTSGTIEGLPPAPQRVITLRRPGGPAPEEINTTAMKASTEAQKKYQVGMSFIGSDNKYVIEDIDPGDYILEVPRMPRDPTDLEAYERMDRTPQFRKTVTVKNRDLKLDIKIRG